MSVSGSCWTTSLNGKISVGYSLFRYGCPSREGCAKRWLKLPRPPPAMCDMTPSSDFRFDSSALNP